MNERLLMLKVPALLAYKTPDRVSLFYIDKIRERVETVTSVLKNIPGYPHPCLDGLRKFFFFPSPL